MIYKFTNFNLSGGVFWYRHHPKMDEMVSDRDSRADVLTIFHEISMRVVFNSKNGGKKKT